MSAEIVKGDKVLVRSVVFSKVLGVGVRTESGRVVGVGEGGLLTVKPDVSPGLVKVKDPPLARVSEA